MSNKYVLRVDDLITRMGKQELKPKLILTGFYADLKMYNDWEKKNQFIPVPRDVSEEYMAKLRAYGYMPDGEVFDASFTDALGHQRNLRIEMTCCLEQPRYSDFDIHLPEHFNCSVRDIEGGYMHVDNIRAIFDITLARVIMGNGDYIRSNLNSIVDHDDRDLY